MEDLHDAIKDLQSLLQNLLKKYDSLKKENAHLKQVNTEMNARMLEKENLIRSSEEKLATTNIVNNYNEEEKELLRLKIDTYLNDIEKCLHLLNG
jgi:hypothetical protein